MASWKADVAREVRRRYAVGEVFSLQGFYQAAGATLREQHPGNNSFEPTVRNIMQRLRDDGIIEFLGTPGTYRRVT